MTRLARTALLRRAAGVSVALLAVASLAACQAGRAAETSQDYDPVDGRNVNVPEGAAFDDDYIGVRNAVVVAIGDSGSLIVSLVNNSTEADVLEAARLDGEDMSLSIEPVEIPVDSTVKAGFDEDLRITIDELEVIAGDWVDLELEFATAGIASIQVLVVPYGDTYVSDDSGAPIEIPAVEAETAE